jgi:L-fucose isomerase-like protein
MDRIKVIARASSLHGERETERLKERLLSEIQRAADFALEEVDLPSEEGLTAILILTGGTEREVLKLVSQLPSPTLLIAHAGHNSLPAALEVLARIRQDGGKGEILFGPPQAIAAGLERELVVARAWEGLRFSRVGLIGEPSDWLVASDVDRAFLKGQLGIELVSIGIDELVERIQSASPSRGDVARFTKGAGAFGEPSKEDLRAAVAVYTALRALVEEHRLSACAVRCFDLVSRLRTSGCYALSRLNDEKIPSGCEGDLQALFSMYVGLLLSSRAGFMGNVAAVDTQARTVTLAHCTCPLSLAASYAIRSHFESGTGVGIAAQIPQGPCTLFRLGGERLDHLFVREGAIEGTSEREDLCRTQVSVSVSETIDPLLTAPLGNHHVLLPGHHQETIERFFRRFLVS